MAGLELPEQRDQLVAVVLGVRHQVAAAHIEPFDPVEVLAEVFFDGFERQPQVVRTRLAEHVEMQTVEYWGLIRSPHEMPRSRAIGPKRSNWATELKVIWSLQRSISSILRSV